MLMMLPQRNKRLRASVKRAVLFHVSLNLTAVWKSCRHVRSRDVVFQGKTLLLTLVSVSVFLSLSGLCVLNICVDLCALSNFLHITNLINSPNAHVSSFCLPSYLCTISNCFSSFFSDFVDFVTRRLSLGVH